MKRREFITLVGGAAASRSPAARAQPFSVGFFDPGASAPGRFERREHPSPSVPFRRCPRPPPSLSCVAL